MSHHNSNRDLISAHSCKSLSVFTEAFLLTERTWKITHTHSGGQRSLCGSENDFKMCLKPSRSAETYETKCTIMNNVLKADTCMSPCFTTIRP